jgi:hypothetical protein
MVEGERRHERSDPQQGRRDENGPTAQAPSSTSDDAVVQTRNQLVALGYGMALDCASEGVGTLAEHAGGLGQAEQNPG